jgi:hypothetical protein
MLTRAILRKRRGVVHMGSRRWGVFVAGAVLAVVVIALGSAGLASGGQVNTSACNQTGRLFCLSLSTFEGITASDASRTNGKRYTWVEWSMANNGGSTLTNPKIVVTVADYKCVPTVARPNPNPSLGECGDALSRSTAFEMPTTPPACTLASATQTLTCSYNNLTATGTGSSTGTTRAYFKTADLPATHSVITIQGTVKERANDGNACGVGDPNCDTFATSIVNAYEPTPGLAETFALNNKPFHLATNDEFSSFDFKSLNPSVFKATFKTDLSGCPTATSTCFQRTLNATTVAAGFSATNPIVFYARLTNLPTGANKVDENNVVATHTYDGGSETIIGDSSAERTTTAGCTFTFNASTIPLPSICAKKIQNNPKIIDVWVWDSSNGGIKFGGS